MKLSTKGRYGLRAMIDLGINGVDGKVSIKSIAERQNISENYLEHIIAALKKSGLVKSSRGAWGGYSLNRPPEEITVGDILRVLEGSLNPVECMMLNNGEECDGASSCVTKVLWKRISDSISDVVDNITLEDMINEQKSFDQSVVKSC